MDIKSMARKKSDTFDRIKNRQKRGVLTDFSFNAFSFFVLSLFVIGGVVLQYGILSKWGEVKLSSDVVNEILFIALSAVVAGVLLVGLSSWAFVLILNFFIWIAVLVQVGFDYIPLLSIISLALFIASSFELIYHWDKVIVLRMGKFKKVHGPGLFILLPLIDRVAAHVDTRIRATDFSAEKTLTKDTVPVHVDALCFWMIWDAPKAILEIENYIEAVTLSAQTALRDSIGQHDLATLLSNRTSLTGEIKKILESKTNPWGITILSVEITDIIIPQELEDAMSKQAQAERERQSRIILGTAEAEIAEKFAEAAEKYKDNPTALQLRAMNMVYEGIRNNASIMLLPSSALDQMNLGGTLGLSAFANSKMEFDGDNKEEKGDLNKYENRQEAKHGKN